MSHLRRQRGSVFVLTLGVLTGLVALVAVLASANKASVRAESNRMEEQRAEIMAESAVQQAISELQQNDQSHTTLNDKWATLGDRGGIAYQLGEDSFRVQILDAGGRLDLNKLTAERLSRLPLSQAQIDSILDWREESKTPRAEGAKDEFYNALPTGYNTKLQSFDSVDELLLVKDITPSDLYTMQRSQREPLVAGSAEMPILSEILAVNTVSADKGSDGKAKLDINSAKPEDLLALGIPQPLVTAIMNAKGGGFRSLGDVLKVQGMTTGAAKAIADNVAVGKDTQVTGRINVNTASEAALSVLFNASSSIPAAIVSRQSSGYRGLGELLDVPDFSVQQLAAVVDRLCVTSHTFIVRAVGQAAKARVAVEATVTVSDDGNAQISGWHPESFRVVRERWGWEQSTNQRIVLGSK